MYAVIRAGGKQHKVAKGDVIEVELQKGDSDKIEFTPILLVDDKGKVRSAKSDLSAARVSGNILGETKGVKLEIYKFKNKRRYRRHTGHRQRYSRVEISDIKLTAGRAKKSAKEEEVASDGT
jgi:large subunit ribosomal protein L21